MSLKYILCIPNSCGFNDVMCKINEAYLFSKKTNRKLIIDTRLSGLADHLSNYLELNDLSANIDLNLNEKSIQYLNTLSCFPNEFTGKINFIYPVFKSYNKYETFSYNFINNKNKGIKNSILDTFKYIIIRIIAAIKRRTIAKDFKFLYKNVNLELLLNRKEDVILFHSMGGGESSIEALKLFKLKKNISKIIISRLLELSVDYDAIHIRNTDISTKYEDFLKSKHDELIGRRVLLCSDDFFVVQSAKEILNESEIFCFNKSYNLNLNKKRSNATHLQWNLSESKIFANNIDIFVDLIGIAKSTNFYYTNVYNSTVIVSGFSKLGENLKNNKQLVNNFLGIL